MAKPAHTGTPQVRRLRVSRVALGSTRDATRLLYARHSDAALIKILEGKLEDRVPDLKVVDTINGGGVSWPPNITSVFAIRFDEADLTLHAVVRDATLVTMLTELIVEQNLANRAWRRLVDAPDGGVAYENPADAPAHAPALALVPPLVALPASPAPAPAPTPTPTSMPTPAPRDELDVSIPLDLAALGVRAIEADIALARAEAAHAAAQRNMATTSAARDAALEASNQAKAELRAAIDAHAAGAA